MIKKIYVTLWVLWMLLIFWFSSQVAQDSQGMSDQLLAMIEHMFPVTRSIDMMRYLDHMSFIIRKLAHFSEYAVLGVLTVLCAREFQLKHAYILGFIWNVLYACSDEFHQLFVPGRSGQFIDVCIDSSGALFGILCLWCCLYIREKFRKEKFSLTK